MARSNRTCCNFRFNSRLSVESRILVNGPFSNDSLRKEGDAKKYIGLAKTSFKVKYANPRLSFHNEKYRNSTDLLKHF